MKLLQRIAGLFRRSPVTIQTATGATLDALAGIPARPAGMTDDELRSIALRLAARDQPGICIVCACAVAKPFWHERPISAGWSPANAARGISIMTETSGPYCFMHWPGRGY